MVRPALASGRSVPRSRRRSLALAARPPAVRRSLALAARPPAVPVVEQPGARNERRASSRPRNPTHTADGAAGAALGGSVPGPRRRSLALAARPPAVPVVERPGARNERRASSRPRNPPTPPTCRPTVASGGSVPRSRRRSLALAARPPGSTTLAGARCSTRFRWSTSPERGTSDGRRRDPGTPPTRLMARPAVTSGGSVPRPRRRSLALAARPPAVPVVEQPGARNERRASSRPRNPTHTADGAASGDVGRIGAGASTTLAGARCSTTGGSGGRAARSEERATGVVETPEPHTHTADGAASGYVGRIGAGASTTLAGARCSTTAGSGGRAAATARSGTSRRRGRGRRCAGLGGRSSGGRPGGCACCRARP